MSPRPSRRNPVWLSLLAATLAGPLMDIGFPDIYLWPFALLATGLFLGSLIDRRWWQGLLLGAITGAGFYGVHIFWMTLYLGPIPWFGLVGAMTLFWAAGGALLALVINAPVFTKNRRARLLLQPLAVAGVWTLREAISSTWPYGGFAWGRLGHSQSDSFFTELVSWVGIAGIGFLLVWAIMLTIQLARAQGSLLLRMGLAVLVFTGLALVPRFSTTEVGTLRVAGIQGNAEGAAIFSNEPRGSVLKAQLTATAPLLEEDVDLVVWPENGSDISPLHNAQAAARLDEISQSMNAPILLGTITSTGSGESQQYFNSALLWQAGKGVIDQYDKIHPVPFAEYMPDRDFYYAIVPDLVSLVRNDRTAGTRNQIVDVAGVPVGVAICYDTSDDALMRQMVIDGAELIALPTNNADFGRTDQSQQQLAITRLRAVETGRAVVNVSTVSRTAIIDADGSIRDSVPDFVAGSVLDNVPRYRGLTPAVLWGRPLEWLFAALGVAGVLAGVVSHGVARRKARREISALSENIPMVVNDPEPGFARASDNNSEDPGEDTGSRT